MPDTSLLPVETAVRAFTESSPKFREAYEDLARQWTPDSPPITIIFGEFGRRLCSCVSQASREDLVRIASLIEEFMCRGNESAKAAVATGMLEAILGQSSAGKFDFRQLAPLIGPESKAYCQAWDKFSGVRTPGLWDC